MPGIIEIRNRQKTCTINLPNLKRLIKRACAYLSLERYNFSMLITDDSEIQAINSQYLKNDSPTDVLSFDLSDDFAPSEVHGEIIISVDQAIANHHAYSNDLDRELFLYLIHGILHLLGFDDDNLKDEQKMREKEKEIINHLKTISITS